MKTVDPEKDNYSKTGKRQNFSLSLCLIKHHTIKEYGQVEV
jgi:hypothetical protein